MGYITGTAGLLLIIIILLFTGLFFSEDTRFRALTWMLGSYSLVVTILVLIERLTS